MSIDPAPFLQAGALGVLLLVLVGLYRLAERFLDNWKEQRTRELEIRQKEVDAEIVASSARDTAFSELAHQVMDKQDREVATLSELSQGFLRVAQESAETNRQATAQMELVSKALDATASALQHIQVQVIQSNGGVDRLTKAIETYNGRQLAFFADVVDLIQKGGSNVGGSSISG